MPDGNKDPITSQSHPGRSMMRDILKLINTARAAFRMAPLPGLPRGIPAKSRLCVLARALRFEVLLDQEDRPFALVRQYRQARMLASAWRVSRPEEAWSGWSVPLPPELSDFVHQFDARRHPDLILASRLADLRAVRTELQSLRLRMTRIQACASVLIAEGRDICLRSREVLVEARRLRQHVGFERWAWRHDSASCSPASAGQIIPAAQKSVANSGLTSAFGIHGRRNGRNR